MADPVDIKVGDFVVVKDWNYSVKRAEKVTAKTFSYKTGWRTQVLRMSRDKVLFAGQQEDVATRLCEQLTSSAARMNQEKNTAGERHRARCENLIAKATQEDGR